MRERDGERGVRGGTVGRGRAVAGGAQKEPEPGRAGAVDKRHGGGTGARGARGGERRQKEGGEGRAAGNFCGAGGQTKRGGRGSAGAGSL